MMFIEVRQQVEDCLNQAVAKHKEGQIEAAIDLYVKSLELEKFLPDWVYENVIVLLSQVGRSSQGLQLRENALKIHANSDKVYRAIGLALNHQGDFENSINFYLKSLKINQKQPDWLYSSLIEMLVGSNRLQQAIEIGHLGIKLHENFPWILYHLAEAFVASENWEEALSYYTKAAEIQSELPNIQDKINMAIEIEKKQGQISSDVANLHAQAVAKHKKGELEKAFSLYYESIELDENQPAWVYANAITLLAQLRLFNKGFELGEKAKKLYCNSSKLHSDEILCSLGLLYKEKGQLNDSIKYYQNAIEIDHNQPVWVYEHLIESLNQKNYFEQAIKYGELGIEINPQSCWLKYHLGNSFAEKELWDKASELYIQILEIDPDFPNVTDKLNEVVSNQTNRERNLDPELSNATPEKIVEGNSVEEQETQAKNYNNSFSAQITQVNLGGYLEGWAIDNFNPDSILEIKIVADGKPLGIVKANKDITSKATNILNGIPKGFRLQIPTELLDDQEHQFELISLKKYIYLISLFVFWSYR